MDDFAALERAVALWKFAALVEFGVLVTIMIACLITAHNTARLVQILRDRPRRPEPSRIPADPGDNWGDPIPTGPAKSVDDGQVASWIDAPPKKPPLR